ncbi:sodium/calcium exchanger protein [Haloglomus halophilum]|uniref:sodium/calcium exchanger protein n=1 Tax=Haloglomus halophilum TaxID=2962672 RepID=UPI0020CA0FDE|nr:sodium:calcium antiporter [Haloglomus halophilum]
MANARYSIGSLAVAALFTLPWVGVWATGSVDTLSTVLQVLVAGSAVLGASFLLAWGAETAEKDVPRAFALAVLAVLAVAPEYAVDALYAYQAGANPGSGGGDLAVANMTGANRILIGLGWSGIALFSIYKARSSGDTAVDRGDGFLSSAVKLDESIATEILFLTAATVWAFLVPFGMLGGGRGIDIVDMLVLVGLYVTYIFVIIRGDIEESEAHVGVPAYLQGFGRQLRIPIVLGLFVYSGFLIFTAVEPFAHGLEAIGVSYGIPEFFMVQWFAPLASESPELIVTAYLVNKARTTASFNALISSKLNQWTLLIGTLVVVYSIALGQYGALPFGEKQAAEIWLTAAQSFFALSILINFRISMTEAVVLLVLFLSQVIGEFVLIRTMTEAAAESASITLLLAFTTLYMVLGLGLFARRFDDAKRVASLSRRQFRGTADGSEVRADD